MTPDPDDETRLVEYERLNPLGKAVYLGGAGVRLMAGLLEAAIDRAATIVADTERAFRQGLDPNVEDAQILEEYEDGRPPGGTPPGEG